MFMWVDTIVSREELPATRNIRRVLQVLFTASEINLVRWLLRGTVALVRVLRFAPGDAGHVMNVLLSHQTLCC